VSEPAVPVGVRWTIGDVSDNGWQALRLSILGAHRLFGAATRYGVCVNSVPVDVAQARVGNVAERVEWRAVGRDDVPAAIGARFDDGMAEGVAWKLAPLRLFPDRWELSLDNDCILWDLPAGMRGWLARGDRRQCLLAEDARALFGQFTRFCGPEPRNAGIRGLPPDYPLEQMLIRLIDEVPGPLNSELDEQGLQVAAVSMLAAPAVVAIDDVTICSPFPPHRPELGRCGAHFCGLNARHFPWQLEGRYAEEWIAEHWQRHWPAVRQHVGDQDAGQWDGARSQATAVRAMSGGTVCAPSNSR
jgi:hypothetical protein